MLTIRNTIAVTFSEAYNTKLKFGATVFAMNECQRFLNDSVPYDKDSIFDYVWTNNTFVGGAIHKHSGANVHYNVEGQVCVLGYKIGEFDVTGQVRDAVQWPAISADHQCTGLCEERDTELVPTAFSLEPRAMGQYLRVHVPVLGRGDDRVPV